MTMRTVGEVTYLLDRHKVIAPVLARANLLFIMWMAIVLSR